MQVIRDFSIGKAHDQAVRRVIKHGMYLKTEDGEETVELNEPLNIFVSTPTHQPRIAPCCTFGEKAMEKYVHDLIEGCDKKDFAYTYHDRLFAYPLMRQDLHLDQMNEVIVALKRNPMTRRAQAITWVPEIDLRSREPPCLQRVQLLIRGGKLNMSVEFRSRDILSAMGPNMFALTRMQEMIARVLGVEVGWYSDTSVSAHIYFQRDIYELGKYYPEVKDMELFCEGLRKWVYA
jgi:thymidylate synthase